MHVLRFFRKSSLIMAKLAKNRQKSVKNGKQCGALKTVTRVTLLIHSLPETAVRSRAQTADSALGPALNAQLTLRSRCQVLVRPHTASRVHSIGLPCEVVKLQKRLG